MSPPSNSFVFRTAERKRARARLGFSGPAGSGKTMSMLLMASGLAPWDKIFVIDTEYESASLYAHLGPFMHLVLGAPFSPRRYRDAIHAAEQAGAEVVIIDSLSHAWAGTGGALDMKDAETAKNRGNSYTAWRAVTPEHNALVDSLLQSPCHILAGLRAKQEYVQERDEQGRTQIRKLGLAPVMRDGIEYEFTVFFDLDTDHRATSTKDRTELFGQPQRISPETGRKLMAWLNTELVHDEATEIAVARKPSSPEELKAFKQAFALKAAEIGYSKNGKPDIDTIREVLKAAALTLTPETEEQCLTVLLEALTTS